MNASKKIYTKILALTVISSILLTGCTQTNNSSSGESETKVSKEINTVKVDYTSEELYNKYEVLLPKVKEIYDNNGIIYDNMPYDTVFDDEIFEKQFKEIKGIYSTELELNDNISSTFFSISENLEGNRNIMFNGAINTDNNNSKDIDIEKTFIKDITEVVSNEFNSGKVDYSEINKFINASLKEERYKHENTTEVFDYGNVKITVTALPTVLYYININ